jgi:DNA-binding transcriptional LysR family regulator
MRSALNPSRRTEQTLSIGSFEVFTTYCLGDVMESLPDTTELRVFELPIGRIEDAVRAGEIDLGITYVPFPHPELSFHEVATIAFGIYVRAGSFGRTPFAAPHHFSSLVVTLQRTLGDRRQRSGRPSLRRTRERVP